MCSLGPSSSLLYRNFYINVVGHSDFNALDCTALKDPTCTHNSQADDSMWVLHVHTRTCMYCHGNNTLDNRMWVAPTVGSCIYSLGPSAFVVYIKHREPPTNV